MACGLTGANDGMMLIELLTINFSEILIENNIFYARKCIGKMSPGTLRPFGL